MAKPNNYAAINIISNWTQQFTDTKFILIVNHSTMYTVSTSKQSLVQLSTIEYASSRENQREIVRVNKQNQSIHM